MFGDHSQEPRPTNNKETLRFLLSMGLNPDTLVRRIRNPNEKVPFFENLAPSRWVLTGGGGGQVTLLGETPEDNVVVNPPGQITMCTYRGHFEAAIKARDAAIKECDYYAYFQCLVLSFASLDAFFAKLATAWNSKNPTDPLEDDIHRKVSIETKIDEWIPRITDGRTIDKAARQWSDFKKLKKIRDRDAVHPSGRSGMTYQELAEHLNAFRYGIALLFGNLHLIVGWRVPAVVINAHYFPDVEVVTDESC